MSAPIELLSRDLTRDELPLIWTIDRREIIENIYYYENGALVLKPEHYDVKGWPPGQPEGHMPILQEAFDRGGWLHGLFHGDALVGVVALDNRFIGPRGDLLQMKILYVSCDYRDQGLGRRLFLLAADKARSWGAHGLYISATPSEHTINFYTRLGCVVTPTPDPDLFALEPEDIHLECAI